VSVDDCCIGAETEVAVAAVVAFVAVAVPSKCQIKIFFS
jgi:hypothetical protein